MTAEQKKLLNLIIINYGNLSQEDMAIEECSELIKAILKHRRGKATIADLIDEIADVEIMIEQLKIIYACDGYVQNVIQYKIDRQLERMRKEE